jgi:hypothetical protein
LLLSLNLTVTLLASLSLGISPPLIVSECRQLVAATVSLCINHLADWQAGRLAGAQGYECASAVLQGRWQKSVELEFYYRRTCARLRPYDKIGTQQVPLLWGKVSEVLSGGTG